VVETELPQLLGGTPAIWARRHETAPEANSTVVSPPVFWMRRRRTRTWQQNN